MYRFRKRLCKESNSRSELAPKKPILLRQLCVLDVDLIVMLTHGRTGVNL